MLEGNCEDHEELGVGGRGRVRFFCICQVCLISKKKRKKKEKKKKTNKITKPY